MNSSKHKVRLRPILQEVKRSPSLYALSPCSFIRKLISTIWLIDIYSQPIGLPRSGVSFSPRSLQDMSEMSGALVGKDSEDFVAFVESMLALEPRDRPEAHELLDAPWLKGT